MLRPEKTNPAASGGRFSADPPPDPAAISIPVHLALSSQWTGLFRRLDNGVSRPQCYLVGALTGLKVAPDDVVPSKGGVTWPSTDPRVVRINDQSDD